MAARPFAGNQRSCQNGQPAGFANRMRSLIIPPSGCGWHSRLLLFYRFYFRYFYGWQMVVLPEMPAGRSIGLLRFFCGRAGHTAPPPSMRAGGLFYLSSLSNVIYRCACTIRLHPAPRRRNATRGPKTGNNNTYGDFPALLSCRVLFFAKGWAPTLRAGTMAPHFVLSPLSPILRSLHHRRLYAVAQAEWSLISSVSI